MLDVDYKGNVIVILYKKIKLCYKSIVLIVLTKADKKVYTEGKNIFGKICFYLKYYFKKTYFQQIFIRKKIY